MSSRRDLMRIMLGAPFLLSCGSKVEEQPTIAGGWNDPNFQTGHRLRAAFSKADYSTADRKEVDIAIVGSGVAGATAAWNLAKHGLSCQVLELESDVGGTSAWGSASKIRHPWGAHYLPLPMSHNADLLSLLSEVGAVDAEGLGVEAFMVREPAERVFLHGHWYPGLFPYAGASKEDVAQLRRFQSLMLGFASERNADGQRAFSIPVDTSARDRMVELDNVTAAAWLRKRGFDSERLLWFLEYGTRDDYGLTLEECSAWALIFYRAARTLNNESEEQPFIGWPQGNGVLVEHMLDTIPVKNGMLIRHVSQDKTGVTLYAESSKGNGSTTQRVILRAKDCVVATPRFIAERIVDGIERVEKHFTYGAWIVANLTLRSRPSELGFEPAWDSVLYGSKSLGYIDAQHQQGTHGKTVWSYYYPLTGIPEKDRKALLTAKWEVWRDAIIADLERAHPNISDVTQRIDIRRWGHGMVQPRPGLISGGARRKAQMPLGRVHFAHTDLSGIALFEEAFFHGMRASNAIVAARSSRDKHTL